MTLSGKHNAKCTVCGNVMPYELPEADELNSRLARPSVPAPRSNLSLATGETVTSTELQAAETEDAKILEEEEIERVAS